MRSSILPISFPFDMLAAVHSVFFMIFEAICRFEGIFMDTTHEVQFTRGLDPVKTVV